MSLLPDPTAAPAVGSAAATPTVSTPAAAAAATPAPPVAAAPAMSSDAARTLGGYGHLPMLTKDNYQKWQMAVKAYLIPYDHVRVITQARGADGTLTDPVRPVDAADLRAWVVSEGIAMGVVAGTTYELHPDLVAAAHEGGSVLGLWKAIEAKHTNDDSSLRHQAWSLLFGHRMTADDDLLEYWRRGADVKARIDRITPRALTGPEVINEIYLFAQVAGLRPDIPLRHYLISRPIPSEAELYAAFLRVATDKKTAAQIETANAAYSPNCHRCLQPGHFAKACPHAEALNKVVSNRLDPNKRKWKPRSQRGGATPASNTSNTSNTSNGTNANTAATASTQESAGVATSFLLSHSPRTDNWIVDSGASRCMTSERSAFSDFKSDR